jgi:hypothetical protein
MPKPHSTLNQIPDIAEAPRPEDIVQDDWRASEVIRRMQPAEKAPLTK